MTTEPDDFAYDEDKRSTNIEKHGIDFLDAVEVFAAPHFTEDRTRKEDGEERRAAIGPIPEEVAPDHWSGELIAVVFTWRGDTIRLISARRADKDERQRYEDHFGGSTEG